MNKTSVEGYGRDQGGAEGEVAINSQAKGPYSDDTLESKDAPTKLNLSGSKTERINGYEENSYLVYVLFC